MRKVIVSMNVTLDGFMAGPRGELDWHFHYWDDEMAKCIGKQLSNADTILLGRVTYKAMAKYWPSKGLDLCVPREDIAFAAMMNSYPKMVVSKTQTNGEWSNSKFIKGNIRKEILKLKQQPGKNIIIYGSGKLVSALMQWNLIDDYVLWVHPVVLGKGKYLFKGVNDAVLLKLLKVDTCGSGVVILHYQQK